MSTTLIRLLALVVFLGTGCATKVTTPPTPMPSAVLFGEFQAVELKPIVIVPEYSDQGANEKARKKIEEHLVSKLRMVFPTLKEVPEFTSGGARTLQIEPTITQIKFIGGAARFWVGEMAGSSVARMHVDYRDSATGEIVASPEFQRVASAYSGAWTIGAMDNWMLEEIAMDVVNYSALNR